MLWLDQQGKCNVLQRILTIRNSCLDLFQHPPKPYHMIYQDFQFLNELLLLFQTHSSIHLDQYLFPSQDRIQLKVLYYAIHHLTPKHNHLKIQDFWTALQDHCKIHLLSIQYSFRMSRERSTHLCMGFQLILHLQDFKQCLDQALHKNNILSQLQMYTADYWGTHLSLKSSTKKYPLLKRLKLL